MLSLNGLMLDFWPAWKNENFSQLREIYLANILLMVSALAPNADKTSVCINPN